MKAAFRQQLLTPPHEYSLLPFWFWNDELDAAEIRRQIAEFEGRGVYGFVIHPRVGLPRELGWMSQGLLGFIDITLAEARRRDMKVLLYDEGMYPSGSSSGQVVARNRAFACRGLAMIDLETETDALDHLPPTHHVVATLPTAEGRQVAIIDRPVDSCIRGLHYIGEGPAEDEPPMADILNPEATASFIELVYDRYADSFGRYFGETVIGIFTDEPNPLGRLREKDVRSGTTGILEHVNRILGYDFTPHLPSLWFNEEPNAEHHRANYDRAIRRRLNETWYKPLHDWCEAHRVALCGHPADGDEIGPLRYFHIPGQDLVWRWVAPDEPSALEGPESTQGKCSSSAMVHLGRTRNSNEFCGAYGHETTFDEFRWLANWCLVRGVNLLIPHAFYYSIRGPRRDERPPQVGPHSPWWDRFKPFADACRRLCWINSTFRHVCDLAILTDSDHCPWRAAKVCFQNQWDFNYLEDCLLLEQAEVSAEHLVIGPMRYRALVVEDETLLTPAVRERLAPLMEAGRVIPYREGSDAELLAAIGRHCTRDVALDVPCPGLRFRHVADAGEHFYLFFTEAGEAVNTQIELSAEGPLSRVDVETGTLVPLQRPLRLQLEPHAITLLHVGDGSSS